MDSVEQIIVHFFLDGAEGAAAGIRLIRFTVNHIIILGTFNIDDVRCAQLNVTIDCFEDKRNILTDKLFKNPFQRPGKFSI